ncbi:MAG: sugar ABC transporter ATP-binding protein [Chloroflexi bacterium]|nr:sugar ABC transporter ATP-binding protein [Chloroflexota bacterium]
MNKNGKERLLKVENISKAFPGVQALQGVDLDVGVGEILALVGENGAGKSTLIQILTGALQADSGQIFLGGQEVRFDHPQEAEEAGLSAVYQELSLVNNLSVAENIFAGRQPTHNYGLMDVGEMNRNAQVWLDRFDATFSPSERVGSLSLGNQQLIEITKAMSRNAKVLILDEPTSSLSLSEAESLFDLLRQLRDQGLGIVFVSHHLEEVFELCDRISVLRDGHYVGTVQTAESDERKIVSMMVGRDLGDLENLHGQEEDLGSMALKVGGFTREGHFQDVGFELRHGEILTFFGLVGAGRTEMARALIGMDKASGGTVEVNGKAARLSHPSDAMRLGMAYLSEDRKREGLYLTKSLKENFLVTNLQKVAPSGWLQWDTLTKLTQTYVDRLNVRTPSLDQKLRNLSGGNQQKVMLGMWLATEPDVLIVDEPTRGIDVGTKQEIHRLLRQLAKEGKAIMVISSDLLETLAISDRVAVMRKGELTGILPIGSVTQEKVMVLAAGVNTKETEQ